MNLQQPPAPGCPPGAALLQAVTATCTAKGPRAGVTHHGCAWHRDTSGHTSGHGTVHTQSLLLLPQPLAPTPSHPLLKPRGPLGHCGGSWKPAAIVTQRGCTEPTVLCDPWLPGEPL